MPAPRPTDGRDSYRPPLKYRTVLPEVVLVKNKICSTCGKCCIKEEFHLWNEEYERIQPYLKEPLVRKDRLFWYFATGKAPCPALDVDGCRIPYKKRPVACRMFPYVLEKQTFTSKGWVMDVSRSRKCRHWRTFPKNPENVEDLKSDTLELTFLKTNALKKLKGVV
jgi:Fe-S-cluster containining protein